MTKQERDHLRDIWFTRVQEFRASGLSGPQWCETRGLKVKQLHYWNHRFAVTDANASAPPWIEMTPSLAGPPREALEVRVGPGTIRIPPAFDPAVLQQVVQVLATC